MINANLSNDQCYFYTLSRFGSSTRPVLEIIAIDVFKPTVSTSSACYKLLSPFNLRWTLYNIHLGKLFIDFSGDESKPNNGFFKSTISPMQAHSCAEQVCRSCLNPGRDQDNAKQARLSFIPFIKLHKHRSFTSSAAIVSQELCTFRRFFVIVS